MQFLRAGTAPTQQYIKVHFGALLEESKFFQIPHLEDRLRGQTSIYDLRLQDRLIKEQETQSREPPEDSGFLVNVFLTDTSPLDANGLGLPLLKATTTRVTMNCDYTTFCARYHALSNNLVGEIAKLPGIVFAGGSVMSALTQSSLGHRR